MLSILHPSNKLALEMDRYEPLYTDHTGGIIGLSAIAFTMLGCYYSVRFARVFGFPRLRLTDGKLLLGMKIILCVGIIAVCGAFPTAVRQIYAITQFKSNSGVVAGHIADKAAEKASMWISGGRSLRYNAEIDVYSVTYNYYDGNGQLQKGREYVPQRLWDIWHKDDTVDIGYFAAAQLAGGKDVLPASRTMAALHEESRAAWTTVILTAMMACYYVLLKRRVE